MPIPKPISNESQNEYMGRCVSFLINEGTPQEQAIAICSTNWDNKKSRKMQHKIYKSSVNDINNKGEVIIAINAIGNVDNQKDRSMPGSFNKTISEGINNIFWYKNHNSDEVLGVPLRLWEENNYVNAHAKFNLDKQFSRDMYSDYKFFQENGKTIKHSVGVSAINFKMDKDIRNVSEWKLWEFSSLTKWPANEDTPTHAIKSMENINQMFDEFDLYLDWIKSKGLYTDEYIERMIKFSDKLNQLIRPLNAPVNEPQTALIQNGIDLIKAPDRGQPNELFAKLNLDYIIDNLKF